MHQARRAQHARDYRAVLRRRNEYLPIGKFHPDGTVAGHAQYVRVRWGAMNVYSGSHLVCHLMQR
jgi:hypothetical protein